MNKTYLKRKQTQRREVEGKAKFDALKIFLRMIDGGKRHKKPIEVKNVYYHII